MAKDYPSLQLYLNYLAGGPRWDDVLQNTYREILFTGVVILQANECISKIHYGSLTNAIQYFFSPSNKAGFPLIIAHFIIIYTDIIKELLSFFGN